MIAVARKWGIRFIISLFLVVDGYAVLGLAGGAIPTNAGWTPPTDGVVVFIESNGIHTGFVLPKRAAGVDWRILAPARDLGDPRYASYGHLAIGWGERAFYLGTPTWADVRPATILAAAIGSEHVLVHLEHVPVPTQGPDVRRIVLRPSEYRRLAAFIEASLATNGRHYPGYGVYDVFLDARGHYDAARTCNAWTGDALRYAGVRVGAWTPFPATVMWWFPRGR